MSINQQATTGSPDYFTADKHMNILATRENQNPPTETTLESDLFIPSICKHALQLLGINLPIFSAPQLISITRSGGRKEFGPGGSFTQLKEFAPNNKEMTDLEKTITS